MKARKNGKTFIIIGLLLITAALCLGAYNIYDSVRAASEANKAAAELESLLGSGSADYMADRNLDMPVQMLDGVEYSGIIEIPDLGLVLPVINNWSYNNLKSAPCRYTGSVYLNNMVIAAHNYRSHFGKIKNLKQDSVIYIVDMDGNVFEYAVRSMEVLESTAVEEMMFSDWDLTLFTCTVGGQARIAIRCVRK